MLAALILHSGPARAQAPSPPDLSALSIEDLAKLKVDAVYGASKFLQKVADAPASVTIITREEIRKYGYRTLADMLRSVCGFYVIYDRNYTYVGVRGFARPGDYNARILFLLDGHRENDNIFDGAYVATEFPVDVDLIERVEITRGPSSSVYGTGAFVAVVNVITKRGRDLNAVEVSTEFESWNSSKSRVSYGTRFDSGLEMLLSGTFYESQGHRHLFFPEFASPATNNGFADHADADQAHSLFADLIYRNLNLHIVDGSRTKHIPTASFGTVFNDPRTQTTDARSYIDAQYARPFGKWGTLGRISYDWYDYHGVYINDYTGLGVPPFTQNIDLANGTWWDLQLDASRVFFKRHHVAFGTEYRQDIRQQQANYDLQPYFLYLDDHRQARVWAYYLQDDFSIRKDLIFVVALRLDSYEKFGNTFSPRLGLIYKLTPNTDLKGIYSRAFRAPNSYENFYTSSSGNTANPSLRPERIRTYELDLEHHFRNWLQASASAYFNRIDALISLEFDPITGNRSYMNSGSLQTRGIELELAAKRPRRIGGTISYSFQNSRNRQTGDILTNSPKHLAKANLSLPLVREKLSCGLEAQYTGERRTVARTDLGGFLVMNVTLLSRNLGKDFALSASLYNLFDKRYADSGGLEHLQSSIPQDGRSFRVKFSYRPYSKAR